MGSGEFRATLVSPKAEGSKEDQQRQHARGAARFQAEEGDELKNDVAMRHKILADFRLSSPISN